MSISVNRRADFFFSIVVVVFLPWGLARLDFHLEDLWKRESETFSEPRWAIVVDCDGSMVPDYHISVG